MVFDTIIIGAGAMGSSAAYWLSKQQDVLLVDQFEPLHHKGSSHGLSRIIRKTYREPYFADMMIEAYRLWNLIQQETGVEVYTETGGLDTGKEGNHDLGTTLTTCEKTELPHEVLDAAEIQQRFPAYHLSDDYYGVYQPDTGILNATRSVDMFQQQASRQGTQMVYNRAVTGIRETGDAMMIETGNQSFTGKNLVITPGVWINDLIKHFGMKVDISVWKLTIAYWKVTQPELFNADKFPVFIHWDDNINYGFPIHERVEHVKIAAHFNDLIPKSQEYDQENEINYKLLDSVQDFISDIFPGIVAEPKFVETCLYSMTSNENFIIDHIPDNDSVTVAGGFSGHGFKFTPLIGKIIADIVIDGESRWDLDQFRIEQFLS